MYIANNRDDARALFQRTGLTYNDVTKENLKLLKRLINVRMDSSDYFDSTFKCTKIEIKNQSLRFWAGIKCEAFYFENREAVSFNDDGFIGFAG